MLLPACPNGKCRCWCGLLQNLDCRIPSRIAELAACNDAPSDSDKQLCQSTLHDLPEDLQTLDNHIECLESTLSALKTVRKKKFSLAHSCRSILHPIRFLPPEILSKIFSDACSSVDLIDLLHEFEEYSSLNKYRAPWTLARVSSRWRQTALSTPRMWSRIGITQKHWHSSRKRLRVQLQLSKSSPLIVAIDWRFFDLPQDMVKTLFPSSPRWETLVLSPDLDPQLRSLEGKLPSLRNLLFYGQSLGQSVKTSTFADAPKLRTLYVSRLDYLPGLDHVSLSQITTFSTKYSGMSIPSDLFGLARLTALQQCTLTFGYFGTDGDASPLILPNLRILSLRVAACGGVAILLKKLTLPALEVLSIKEEDLETLGLAPFVQRSQCILKELHLESRVSMPVSMSTVEDITIAFERSLSLERLTLDHEFVAVLASRIDLLPSLKVLVTLMGGQQPDLYLLRFLKDVHPELVVAFKNFESES